MGDVYVDNPVHKTCAVYPITGPVPVDMKWELATQSKCETGNFAYWMAEMQREFQYHRKLWEMSYVCQLLWQNGMLEEGRRGLGFGVGVEPLPAFFAKRGASIVATDAAITPKIDSDWVKTGQHIGEDVLKLNRYQLLPDEEFREKVQYRTADMNNIPEDLRDFDFCWSNNSFDHLGSIEAGQWFVLNTLKTLKVGGYSVHTTEFNVSSNDRTIEVGDTCFYRKRDLERLQQLVSEQGHYVAPLDLSLGYGFYDRYVDMPPYRGPAHIRLLSGSYVVTSVGLVVRREH